MSSPGQLRVELEQRLQDFYRELAEYGEVAPGVRFRLEGMLQTALWLQCVDEQQLQRLVHDIYREHMGEAPAPLPGRPEPYHLPVHWQRAPVFPSGGPKS